MSTKDLTLASIFAACIFFLGVYSNEIATWMFECGIPAGEILSKLWGFIPLAVVCYMIGYYTGE